MCNRPRHVSLLERGRINVTVNTTRQISHVLQISLSELLRGLVKLRLAENGGITRFNGSASPCSRRRRMAALLDVPQELSYDFVGGVGHGSFVLTTLTLLGRGPYHITII